MKIAFTADTHLTLETTWGTDEAKFVALRDAIYAENPDVIAHGGDIGEWYANPLNLPEALRILGENKECVGVIGNHDLWTKPDLITSEELWSRFIPEIFQNNKWHYLEQSNWIKDGVAIVGSYLHYDYSAADPEGAAVNHIRANYPDWTPDEYYERMKKRAVNDAKYFIGLPRDKDFAKTMGDAFKKRLLEAQEDKDIHSIVVVTHVPCMPCQITRNPHDWHWSCATAYFGNLSYVETLMSCSKIKFVLSGHSHQDNRNQIEFDDEHMVDIITLGSDYGKPIFVTVEV